MKEKYFFRAKDGLFGTPDRWVHLRKRTYFGFSYSVGYTLLDHFFTEGREFIAELFLDIPFEVDEIDFDSLEVILDRIQKRKDEKDKKINQILKKIVKYDI